MTEDSPLQGAIPAFAGFRPRGLHLLRELSTHNTRPWFSAHEQEYRQLLLRPAQAFVLALGQRLRTMHRAIRVDTRTDGTGVLMRLHRDTRFSADKAPYNTTASGLFWADEGKKTESPAFGFQLDPDGMNLMAGILVFPRSLFANYRAAVMDDRRGADLDRALTTVREAGPYSVGGLHYRRVPPGFDLAHPRATLLRHRGLYAYPPRIEVNAVATPRLVDICFQHFQAMAPLYSWLAELMG